MFQQNRGVTPVISTVLMVAIVVVLAVSASVLFVNITEDIKKPAPIIGDSTGEFRVAPPGERAGNRQIVQITHVAGDSIPVEELELIVRASGPNLEKESRLVALPSDDSTIDQNNIEGDDIIDEGGPDDRVIVEDVPADDNVWEPGETIEFRIITSEADFRKGQSPHADVLEVIIVHTPSDTVILEDTFSPYH